jgi:hypothetical protein
LAVIIKKMQKPLLYFEKIKLWEIGIMVSYVLLSVEFCFFLRFAKSEIQNQSLYFYAVFTQLFLYHMFYKSMRNLNVYVYCLFIGILHLCLYQLLKENASIINLQNNKIISLRNTIILILIFQFLRFISLKTQNKELVCISKNKRDILDGREITRIDSILYAIYIATTFILLCIG